MYLISKAHGHGAGDLQCHVAHWCSLGRIYGAWFHRGKDGVKKTLVMLLQAD